jgi:hypothetical protein
VFVDEQLAGADRVGAVVVRGDVRELAAPGSLPVVVAWVGDQFGGTGPAAADVVVGEDDVDAALASMTRSPLSAATLAVLLRSIVGVTVDDGLAMESAAYSVLQAGPEFAAWRAGAPHVADTSADPVVSVERRGDELLVTLDRPHRHNAINARLRDELYAALTVAAADDSVASILLRGSGPSFSSGGDLGEFGTRSDPATAHVTRLARSPSRLIHQLRGRTHARIHGAALGGGIEMAAFAERVIAHPDTVVALPEIELGLIPGAGGTVSLTRRIGRQRTAALALTGRRIDAVTALTWRLVDELEPA